MNSNQKKAKFRLFFNKQPIGYSADFILEQPNNAIIYLRPLHNNLILEMRMIKYHNLNQTY